MTRLRCHRFARSVSFALIGALLFGILAPPGAMVSRAAAAPGVKTVLAFPAVDDSDAGNLADVAARVTSALALAGQDVRDIDLEVFSPTSPMVRRALADGSLRTVDVEAPKDANNALIIGQAFGVDSVALLGVESLKISGEPRTAEIAVLGTEYMVAGNVDADTGAVVAEPKGNTFGVSGIAKGRQGATGDDEALTRLAAKDAAFKILHVLSGKSAEEYVEQGAQPKKRSNLWRWVAIAIVVGALTAATISSNKEKAGPTTDDTIPTRRSARATTDGIRLTWAAPASPKVIFKYEIQRSADGGVFVRIDNDKLGPDATLFTDFAIVAGTAYVYQIRALFTDGTSSPWAIFNQVVAP
jgi:hypothetical protein